MTPTIKHQQPPQSLLEPTPDGLHFPLVEDGRGGAPVKDLIILGGGRIDSMKLEAQLS